MNASPWPPSASARQAYDLANPQGLAVARKMGERLRTLCEARTASPAAEHILEAAMTIVGVSEVRHSQSIGNEGMLVSSPAGRVIVVRATDNRFRQLWTVAHELAHVAIPHPACDIPSEDAQELEFRCNALAEGLLLPQRQLVQLIRSALTDNPQTAVLRAARHFGVSVEAALRSAKRTRALDGTRHLTVLARRSSNRGQWSVVPPTVVQDVRLDVAADGIGSLEMLGFSTEELDDISPGGTLKVERSGVSLPGRSAAMSIRSGTFLAVRLSEGAILMTYRP
jgi:Zn-dependent peptidase ImmA (M78 family)